MTQMAEKHNAKVEMLKSISAKINNKDVAAALENVGTTGLSELADFTSIDFTGNTDFQITHNIWKLFLRYVQSKSDNTIMGKAIKIMRCK